jgi:Tfp pilus assembly protein PilV
VYNYTILKKSSATRGFIPHHFLNMPGSKTEYVSHCKKHVGDSHVKSGAGFTLIEIAIAVFLMGTLISIFAATISLQHLIRDSKYRDIALRIASHKLENYRAVGYASSTESGPFTDSLLATLPYGSASSTIAAYNAKTKIITVGVSWAGRASTTKYQSMTTLITDVGGL